MPSLIWIFTLFSGMAATIVGLKSFEAWSQVIDLWEAEVSPLLLVGHPHFFRYLIAYPGFLLENELPNLGFSIYVSVFFATNVTLWRRLSYLCQDREPAAWTWAIFLIAHMFMNGRGVIAWTAWLLCAILCLRMSRHEGGSMKHLLLLILTCWLSAVSTGIFVVTVTSLLFFYLRYRKHAMRRSKLTLLLSTLLGVPAFAIVTDYFWVALQKNVEFFGGGLSGVFNMLQHGLGRVLFDSNAVAILVIYLIALTSILMVFRSVNGRVWSPLKKLIFLSLCGGLFGFTVLTSVIPLFLIYVTPRRKGHEISTRLNSRTVF